MTGSPATTTQPDTVRNYLMKTKPAKPGGGLRREANRRNSQKSSGPKTREGKQASSQNATKHGLLSEKALLPGETLEEYEAFQSGVRQQLRPRNGLEDHLLEHYCLLLWRSRRLPEFEVFTFNR